MKNRTKPTIMILGTTHLDNPGIDAFNYKMDDVLTTKRQSEIKQLVQQLKEYKPTKIAIEWDQIYDSHVQTDYQEYLNGEYELDRGEHHQIGFRLAEQMGHPKLYCVDYRLDHRKDDPFIPWDEFDVRLIDYYTFAKEHNQEYLLPSKDDHSTDSNVELHEEKDGRVWVVPKNYISIIDMYIKDNKPEGRLKDHQYYLRGIARIGIDKQYPGANWLSHSWYDRNLKIFVNLTRISESTDERLLLIIGAGHVYLIQQFFEESGDYIIESPLKYIKSEDIN